MASRKKKGFLDDLNDPSLDYGRRLALTLLLYVDLGKVAPERDAKPIEFGSEVKRLGQSLNCVDCGGEIDRDEPSVIYCSDFCRQKAQLIRYVRRGRRQKREAEIEFQIGIGDNLLHLPGGGYPARDRFLATELRDTIFKRDNHTCQICLAKHAQHIDHIRGSSNDPSNLQASCADCNRAKAFSNLCQTTPEEAEQIEELYIEMAGRIAAFSPAYACDDQLRWQKIEPKIRAVRRTRLCEADVEERGIRYADRQRFFEDVFGCRDDDEFDAARSRITVACSACNQLITRGAAYIVCSRRRVRTCVDCIIDYLDGGFEDVDGYLHDAAQKDDRFAG